MIPGASKDGSTVPVLIIVGDLDGLVETVGYKTDENRAENLFLVTRHIGSNVGDDGWSDLRRQTERQ